jgi:hypothetical protein
MYNLNNLHPTLGRQNDAAQSLLSFTGLHGAKFKNKHIFMAPSPAIEMIWLGLRNSNTD